MENLSSQILLQIVFILLNAFFAGSEIAFLSLNTVKLGKQAADGLFRLHPAEAAQIDGILRLAFSAVDHFVSRCVGEHLLYQKTAKGAVDLPECQRGGLPAGIGQPA